MKLRGRARQHLRTALREQHEVLDADPAATLKVDAGLDTENHARLKHVHAPRRCQPRWLVHFQADAVAGPVDEGLAEASLRDRVPGDGIDRGARHPRPHSRHCLLLGVEDNLPGVAELSGNRIDAERACHVGAVSAKTRAHVEQY